MQELYSSFHILILRCYLLGCSICPATVTEEETKFIETVSLQGVVYATIVAKDEIYQIVEDNKYVCYTKDLITTTTAMICCYHIFNICYPASSSNTSSFVQEVFLGIGIAMTKIQEWHHLLGNCHNWSVLFLKVAESDPSRACFMKNVIHSLK